MFSPLFRATVILQPPLLVSFFRINQKLYIIVLSIPFVGSTYEMVHNIHKSNNISIPFIGFRNGLCYILCFTYKHLQPPLLGSKNGIWRYLDDKYIAFKSLCWVPANHILHMGVVGLSFQFPLLGSEYINFSDTITTLQAFQFPLLVQLYQ